MHVSILGLEMDLLGFKRRRGVRAAAIRYPNGLQDM